MWYLAVQGETRDDFTKEEANTSNNKYPVDR